MKYFLGFPILRFSLLLGLVMVLCSCVSSSEIAQSRAEKQQLFEIIHLQQQHEMQIQQLQQQLDKIQQKLAADKTTPDRADNPTEVDVPTTPVIVPPPSEQLSGNQEVANVAASASSYLAAFSNLAAGNAAAAEAGFESFLREFPDHQYAPNARYWLASAQLALGKTNPAIKNLNQIITDPKAQTKAPAALVKLAQIYRRAGLTIQADNVLEQLRDRYPDSPEAQQFNRSDKPEG